MKNKTLHVKKVIVGALIVIMMIAFCSCGSDSEEQEPTGYDPVDIQVEAVDDDSNAYLLIYDVSVEDTDQWNGYPEHERELQTALNGIKQCISRDDWTPTSVIHAYGGEAKLSNQMYSYGDDGLDGNLNSVKFFQYGIYTTTYQLTDELDQGVAS